MHRASKNNQQVPGRTRGARSLAYANEVESGAAPARAFKALPNLLHVHRLLPGRHHQRLGSRPSALRPRVGSSGTYRIRYESYSERITRVGLRTERRGKAQVAVASKLIPCVTREACSRKQGKRTKYHIVEARAGVLFCYVQRRRCGPARTTRRKSWGGFGGSLPSAAGTPPYIHCCQGVTLDSQACTPLGWKHSRGCKR